MNSLKVGVANTVCKEQRSRSSMVEKTYCTVTENWCDGVVALSVRVLRQTYLSIYGAGVVMVLQL